MHDMCAMVGHMRSKDTFVELALFWFREPNSRYEAPAVISSFTH